jgi:hypothetical protein
MCLGTSGCRAIISGGGVQSGFSLFAVILCVPFHWKPARPTPTVAQRRAVSFNEIELSLRRIDDDGARRMFALIAHSGAAEAGAVQAEDVIDALLRRAAAQHLQPLVVGLGLRETDGTKQGGDCCHGRNTTSQHKFHPAGGEWCGVMRRSYGLSRAKAIAPKQRSAR